MRSPATPQTSLWCSLDGVTLIDVPTLAGELAQSDPPAVIDVRFRLGGPPTRPDYLAAHVPGAVFLDIEADFSGPPGPAGRHPLPQPAALQAALRRAGVRADRAVVVYDDGDGVAAARAWWTLRWAGHPLVHVLDGGYAGWLAAGRPVEPGEAEAAPGDFEVRPGALSVLDATAAAELARTGVLLDARTEARYLGEHEPVDPVAGHIPGAVNLPVAQLSGPDGRLLAADRLREIFEQAGITGDTVGAYCGSGINAARTVLALTVAGVADPALYVGSWSNWITDPTRPVATGAQR
jgi:thiosulfate/3-mercaptopyruvate sulfurtransferase